MDSYAQGALYGLGILAVSWFYVKWLPAADLKRKFGKLGNMSGMTKDEIVRIAGKPKAINYFDGGYQATWKASTYIVIIQFDTNDRCTKLVSEIGA